MLNNKIVIKNRRYAIILSKQNTSQKNDVKNFFMGPQFYSGHNFKAYACSEIILTKNRIKTLTGTIQQ